MSDLGAHAETSETAAKSAVLKVVFFIEMRGVKSFAKQCLLGQPQNPDANWRVALHGSTFKAGDPGGQVNFEGVSAETTRQGRTDTVPETWAFSLKRIDSVCAGCRARRWPAGGRGYLTIDLPMTIHDAPGVEIGHGASHGKAG